MLRVGRPGVHARVGGVVRVGEVRVPDHGHGGEGGEGQVGGRFLHARFRVADDAAAAGAGQVGGLEPFRTLHELVLDFFALLEGGSVQQKRTKGAQEVVWAYFGERAEASLARDGAKVAEDCCEASSQSLSLSLSTATVSAAPCARARTFLTTESGRVVVDDESEPLEAVEELDDAPPPLGFLEPDLRRRTLVQRRLHDLVRLQAARRIRRGGAAPLEGRGGPDVRLLLLFSVTVTVTVRRPCERQAREVQVEDGRRHRR